MTRIAVFFAVVACGPSWALAQKAPALSPEELVSLYYSKMGAGDTTALAERMHSAELAKFRRAMLPVLEAGIASGDDAWSGFTQGDTLDEVRAYTPKKFFSRFLQSLFKLKPGLEDALKNATIAPIGHVAEQTPEGETVHVVYRMTTRIQGVSISKVSVMSLRQDGDQWKLLLTGEIEGLAQSLKQQLKR